MEEKKRGDPYTIDVDNKINNAPPPYEMSGPSQYPPGGPEQQQQQYKLVPSAPQSSAPNDTSAVISFPEIVDSSDTAVLIKNMDFTEKSIRQGFIRKVFGILLLQLLITALTIFGLLQLDQYVDFAEENFWIVFGTSVIFYLFTFLTMMCFENARRKVPYNYIFLLLFTLSMSVMVSLVVNVCTLEQVMFAAGSTFALVLALTLFAFQTKIDFTLLSGTWLCLLLPLALLGIGVLTRSYDTMYLVYTTFGIIIISIYIVWDVQLIIGGKHRYGFSPEEYVFAAVILYVDIMYLFLKLLRYAR